MLTYTVSVKATKNQINVYLSWADRYDVPWFNIIDDKFVPFTSLTLENAIIILNRNDTIKTDITDMLNYILNHISE